MELQMLRLVRSRFAIAGAVFLAVLASPLVIAQQAHHSAPPSMAASGDEGAFLRENEAAMTKMMKDMAATPTGDIDRDFVAMMIPHHQGAIDMAAIELKYGKNEQLRRLAQQIVVDQTQEIAAMKLAIGDSPTTSAPAPTQPHPSAAGQSKH
jgi:uncharacterized protein (DUF305 family)